MLALVKEGYALLGGGNLPIAEKAQVQIIDQAQGLLAAAKALSAENRFGDLTALYVRKSSAEINAEGKK